MLKIFKMILVLVVVSTFSVNCESVEPLPNYSFLPLYGFMKSKDALKKIDELRQELSDKIKLIEDIILVLTKEDQLKLKFLLKQVVSYK